MKLELSEPQLSVSELGHHQQQVAEWRLSADNLHWDVATGRQMADRAESGGGYLGSKGSP